MCAQGAKYFRVTPSQNRVWQFITRRYPIEKALERGLKVYNRRIKRYQEYKVKKNVIGTFMEEIKGEIESVQKQLDKSNGLENKLR